MQSRELLFSELFDAKLTSQMNCMCYADKGEVYTWGWKECVPSVKITRSWATVKSCEDETAAKQSLTINEQGILETLMLYDHIYPEI